MASVKYTKDHEWVRIEGDTVVVGITDYAQSQLGDVVYVELPEVGRRVQKGKEAAVVESVKAASEVFAPLSGEPGRINSDPMGAGWFMKLRISNAKEMDDLMDEKTYNGFVEGLH